MLPVDGPPVAHGAVLIGGGGRIEAVGADATIPRPEDVAAHEFGDAFLIPGLINTHTHLELTGFAGQVEDQDFAAWIRHLRQLKTTRSPENYLQAARQGLADCFAAGVTVVADTGDSGAAIQALSEAGGAGIAYQEVFGPDPSQAGTSLDQLQKNVRVASHWAGDRVHVGVSPHAPYTVSGPLFKAVSAWARSEGLPIAVHLAESPEEVQFLLAGRGPFAEAWRDRGIALPSSRNQTPVAWVANHDVLGPQTLCIHAVQVGPADVHRLADAGAAVAHCPLSNRNHGHGNAPLAALLQAGIRVGLGTDSVASVGRLDLLAEARAARTLAALSADQTLELCTLGGARALGLGSETGSLTAGKWGDCCVIRMTGRGGAPAEQVLASSPAEVLGTYAGGKEVYRAP